MLFSVRLVSRQPTDVSPEAWQAVVGEQLKAVKAQYDQGKIRAIYRETGLGVLAIYDAADPARTILCDSRAAPVITRELAALAINQGSRSCSSVPSPRSPSVRSPSRLLRARSPRRTTRRRRRR